MIAIRVNNKDIGIATFYKEEDEYVLGVIVIHPDYQNKAIATRIINKCIDIVRNDD